MSHWQPEIVVSEELAAALVAGQFPELAGAPIRLLGRGWDYTAYLVGDASVFRFPRREVVLPGMAREIAAIPRFAALLPVAVPAATVVGVAADGFPWPFFGAPFIPGREPAELALDDGARSALARPLARALRVLHSAAVLDTAGELLPDDPIGRGDMQKRVPQARERAAELGWVLGDELRDAFARAENLPPAQPTAVCHGDLHMRQLLVEDGRLAGVIDWVDVCRGDPGIDLSLVWSFFPPPVRVDFLDEYGPVSEESLLRARVLAVCLNAILASYGRHESLPAVEREALGGLQRAASP